MLRTHTCGELRASDSDKIVTLCGWIDTLRTHGKIGFINIRDRYGITQVILSPQITEQVKNYRKESVIKIAGKVKKRPDKLINKDMPTGEIELEATSVELLNPSEPVPLDLGEQIESTEETRLKYRFLDLRRKSVQKNIICRYRIVKAIRDFMDAKGFLEIETPFLAKSTPEGARDYLVPSRIYPGTFFALPQSPQLFKQLLMVAGFDKYFQIVRCFRDEDLRADRQPEFTQCDIEMSFIEEEDIYAMMESMLKQVFKQVLNVEIKIPFSRITYDETMKKYKTDRPDTRKDKTNPNEFAFCWVVDFPLLQYSEEEKRLVSVHHPFTSPKKKDIPLLEKEPEKAKSQQYDLVLNGSEIAGGSIRIHDRETQLKVFKVLGLNEHEVNKKFKFLLDAFQYGAPPHGGIAFGLDRLVAIMTGNTSIKEVIAFPKNKDAKDLMLDAPSEVYEEQLDELSLKIKK